LADFKNSFIVAISREFVMYRISGAYFLGHPVYWVCDTINMATLKYKKAQLTLTNPRDSKGCKNCSNSTCFVSFHRIPFPQISNYQCI